MGRRRHIPDGVIRIPLPGVRQQNGYSCGAVALMAIMAYYGVGPENQYEYVTALGSDPNLGTPPQAIVRFARKHGLKVVTHEGMTADQLKKYLDARKPVIVDFQAHGTPDQYEKNQAGHYSVAIGFDDKHIYLEDPVLDAYRGYIPWAEFERRWHDKGAGGRLYDRLGIVVWKPNARHYLSRAAEVE
jgi:predicted double-glycine peptidase